jgi:hypothetical protein
MTYPNQPSGYGPPPGGQPGSPPPAASTNGTAIAALVFSLLLAPVGIILAYVARSEIKRTGEGGAGLAKAALIIGSIFTLIPLIVGGVLVAGFSVSRISGSLRNSVDAPSVDASEVFNPKVVKYEIFGEPGASADINYLDLDAKLQQVAGASLPWSLELSTTAPSAHPNIVAQGNGSTISCRITVDHVVKDERSTSGPNAQTFCLVKTA